MFAEFEAFLHRHRRRFSRSEWAIRHWKLAVSEESGEETGLLLIQIDGLSREQLQRALDAGRMPFLAQLIAKDRYKLNTFYSGLPSSTPAVQAELYYGVKTAVPAFAFLDRATGKLGSMFESERAESFEQEFARLGEPLLRGGSSWSNIYSGGAEASECHFCFGTLGKGDFFRGRGWFSTVTFMLMQLPALIRILGLMVLEAIIGFWDFLSGLFQGQAPGVELGSVLSRMCVGIGMREVLRIGGRIDVARGLPIVHLNLLGYDEMSHRRGPDSGFAHWSLKGIDESIADLARAAHRSRRRDYRVWIFSDHGQERTRSFESKFPGGIKGVVERSLASLPIFADKTFSIASMGPVGHIYLNAITADEARETLARSLVTDGRVPAVMLLRANGQAVWFDAAGSGVLPDLPGRLGAYPTALRAEILEDLGRLCRNENSGEIILLGCNGDDDYWSFAPEKGAHAGIGRHEVQGFLLTPPRTTLPDGATGFVRPTGLRKAAFHLLGTQSWNSARPEYRAERQLRVISYNTHSCLGMDGRVSPRRIARVLAEYDADVIALQEMDHGRSRSRGEDQATLIADLLGFHVVFCPTVTSGGGRYGHAVLSRMPIETVKVADLPSHPDGFWPENRGALWTRVKVGNIPVNIVTTHLGLSGRERYAQMTALLGEEWLGPTIDSEAGILCGDFNFIPGSKTHQLATSRLRDSCRGMSLKTFSSSRPTLRLDHIFVTKHFAIADTTVIRNQLTRVSSDHLPLVADLILEANPDELASVPAQELLLT